MATVIRVEIRLEEEPDALYREAYRRAALAVPARPLATSSTHSCSARTTGTRPG